MKTITKEELTRRLSKEKPRNDDKYNGFALVNVLQHEDFLEEHVPGSINIPKGDEIEFERNFDKSKEIIVYCGSFDCPASTKVAETLEKRGFSNVVDYKGGMQDWKQGGNRLEKGEVSREIHAM